jgi:hypothetical protein
MKTKPTFGFCDEPQFRTTDSRSATANRLRSYRNRANGNARRYSVNRVAPGHYQITLRYPDSPVALIITR